MAVLGLTAVLLALPGLAPATPPGTDSEASFDNVDVVDPGLNGKISVTRVGSDRTNMNLLSVFADLKNLTGVSLTIEAQTLYRDGNGDWIDGGHAGWVPLELKPHEEFEYRSASLSENAQDFLVRIKKGA